MMNPAYARRKSLESDLRNLTGSAFSKTAEEASELLLFGLDHSLISPDAIHRLLQQDLDFHRLGAIRFASRLLAHGYEALWDYLWGAKTYRDWLLVAAFDILGEDIAAKCSRSDLSYSYELVELWDFLLSWNGCATSSTLRVSGASAKEEALTDSSNFAVLSAPLVIVGFSGMGKSTLSESLVESGLHALDVDDLCCVGDVSIGTVFATRGALTARNLIYERFVSYLQTVRNESALLIGSSTTNIPDARRFLMKATCPVIHATASPEAAINRIKSDRNHPLSSYCITEYGAKQLAKIKLLRGDHYYGSDMRIQTQHISLKDWWSSEYRRLA